MTPKQAKDILKSKLAEYRLEYKLTARTVNLDGLARGRAVFVTVHDWQPGRKELTWDELKSFANRNGFFIE